MSNTPRLSTQVLSLDTDDIYHVLVNHGIDELRATAFADSLSDSDLGELAKEMGDWLVEPDVFTAVLTMLLHRNNYITLSAA